MTPSILSASSRASAHATPRRSRISTIVAAVSALTMCAGIGLSACGDDEPAHSLVGYRPSGVQQVAAVAMTDASAAGAPFEFRADEGKLLIAYFGYTSCPDVCPTTLAMLKTALARLGEDADRVQLAMATIDPARDTAEVLTGYVQSFVPGAHAVRTDDAAVLRDVTDAFGVSYMVTAGVDGSVEVAHSGAMYVVDDRGDLLLTWPFGVTADDVEGDIGVILGEIDGRGDA